MSLSWTNEPNPFDGNSSEYAAGIVWAESLGLWVATGTDASQTVALLTSPDGVVWTARPSALDGGYGSGVCWSDPLGLLVAVGADAGSTISLVTSLDGIVWTPQACVFDGGFGVGAAWSDDLGLFVVTGSDPGGAIVCTSPDGMIWTTETTPWDGGSVSVGTAGWCPVPISLFIVPGSDGSSNIMTSPDGSVWTVQTTPVADQGWHVSWSPTFGLAIASIQSTNQSIMTSPDGLVWSLQVTTTNVLYWSVDIGGMIVAVGNGTVGSPINIITSTDAVNWITDPSPFDSAFDSAYAVAFSPSRSQLVAGGQGPSLAGNLVTICSASTITSTPAPIVPLWRFFIAALDGSGITDYSKLASDRVVEVVLNAPLTMSGTVPSDNPQVWIPYDGDTYDDPYLNEGTRLLWGFRRESNTPPYYTVRGATIVNLVQDDAAQDDARTRFIGRDPWSYMFSRLVRKSPTDPDDPGGIIGPDGISWNDTKVSVIIGQILRNTIDSQGHAFIDAGDGSRIGEGSQYDDWGGTAYYAGTLEADPVIDWNIPQGTTVGQAWQALCAAGYCDIILSPIYDPIFRPNYLVELNVYAQAGVTRDEQIFAWNAPGRSLVGLSRQEDGAQRANRLYFEAGVGGWIGAAPVQEDVSSVAKFGSYEARQFFPGFVGSTVDEKLAAVAAVTTLADQQLALRKAGKKTVTFKPAPERSPRPWQDYQLGDRVPVWALPQGFRKLLG